MKLPELHFGADSRSSVVLPLVAIAIITWLFHHDALDRWWCCDDTQILKHAVLYSPFEYFFVPEAWRALIPYSLTPWLTFSYEIDLWLFGFDPRGFYAHNLAIIGACAWMIYLLARQWSRPWPALGGAILFLAGSPIVTASQQLMTRHYVEGLFFYLLALWLVSRGLRIRRPGYGLLAGLAYAVAASAKEVYLPLGFMAFLLPVGSWKQRLQTGWPILLVMALYVPWRWYMLGNPLGGYTTHETLAASDQIVAALHGFAAAPGFLFRPRAALLAIGLLAVIALWRAGKAAWPVAWRTLVLIPLLLLPLVPLAKFPGLGSPHYYIAPWAALSLFMAILFGAVSPGGPRATGRHPGVFQIATVALFLASVFPAWKSGRIVLTDNATIHAVYRAQGLALADLDDSYAVYSAPNVAAWYSSGILDLRPVMGRHAPAPLLVFDEVQLAENDLGLRRVLRYSPESQAMADITREIPETLARWRGKQRPVPVSMSIEYDSRQQTLHWRFDPADAGLYYTGNYLLAPRGSLRMIHPPAGCLRYRLDLPDGGVAYSPALRMPHEPDASGLYQVSSNDDWGVFVPVDANCAPKNALH